jgi:hypothetical protein
VAAPGGTAAEIREGETTVDSRRIIEGDLGRTRQIRSQNFDGRAHAAGRGQSLYKAADLLSQANFD